MLTVFLLVDLGDGLGQDGAEGDGRGGRVVAVVSQLVGRLLVVLQRLLGLLLLQRRHHVLVGLPGLLGQRHQPVKETLQPEEERFSRAVVAACRLYCHYCLCGGLNVGCFIDNNTYRK